MRVLLPALRRPRSFLVHAAASLVLSIPVHATAELGATHEFNIPAQALASALNALAAAANERVLFSGDLVAGLRSPQVTGTYTTDGAIAALLKGSALRAERTASGAVLIRVSESAREGQDAASKAAAPNAAAPSTPVRLAQASSQGSSQASAPSAQSVGSTGPAITSDAVQGGDGGQIAEVVVTSTRVQRPGYDAPTPTTVVGSDFITDRDPSNVVDTLVTLPQFKGSATPGTAGVGVSGTVGASFVNLRGLGANRTLVLLDGERLVPNTASGEIDVSMIPTALLQRVDVVTGGASADWGSDAVSGVVNFILDTKFTGLKANAEGGVSAEGDDKQGKASIAYGTDFAGGRGHAVFSGEYYDTDGVDRNSRDWATNPVGVVSNPNYKAGAPCTGVNCYQRFISYNDYFSSASFGGVITGGPLKGIQFSPTGAPEPFTYGTYVTPTNMVMPGPSPLPSIGYGGYLSVPQSRGNLFTRLSYDLADDATGYVEGSWATSDTTTLSSPPNTSQKGTLSIAADNAYLPASISTAMTDDGITSIPVGFVHNDWGHTVVDNKNTTGRLVLGIEGTFAGWKYNAHASYGDAVTDYSIGDNVLWNNLVLAADAVHAPNGGIVCRSTLTNPNNGCQPIDVFGIDQASAAALAYIQGTSTADLTYKQDVASVNVSGEPFSVWAGPVSLAWGGEYRHEHVEQAVDPNSQAGLFFVGNPQALDGSDGVGEAFIETVVPLARDLPLLRSLDFNGAVRETDYTTSGAVTTWKAGLTDTMTQSLKLRMTHSRDIRAPSLLELFTGRSQTTPSVTDPFRNNAQGFVEATSIGNPDLTPEISNTNSIGLVFEPVWLPGFSGSVDYYHVQIDNAISTLTPQNIVDRCYSGNESLCALITRDSTGIIRFITTPYLNLAQVTTSGIDFEANYSFHVAGGLAALHALGSWVPAYTTFDGVTKVPSADSLDDGQPRWSGDVSGTYTLGAVRTMIDYVFIGGGDYDAQYTGFEFFDNHVASVGYVNASLQYSFQENWSVYVNGNNLLDRRPPGIFNYAGGANYDRVGRAYKIGVRLSL